MPDIDISNGYEEPFLDENTNEYIIQKQFSDFTINQSYENNRKIASMPIDLYHDSDTCQGLKRAYDWTTSITRPVAYTAAENSLYLSTLTIANRNNSELNEALQETLKKRYSSFDQIEAVSFDTVKKRLGKTIGIDNIDQITYASLENALKSGYINIVVGGDVITHELSLDQLSAINSLFHSKNDCEEIAKNGIKEIEDALKSLGYDPSVFESMDGAQIKQLADTGKTTFHGKEYKINHLTTNKDGKIKKSSDAVLVENLLAVKQVKLRLKQKEKAKRKTEIKGRQWIDKSFGGADVYQGYIKVKNAVKGATYGCVSLMYIKHYTQHLFDEKVIKSAENAFLKVDLLVHDNIKTGYEHSTKYVNKKERILDKQQERSEKFKKKEEKIQKRHERKKMKLKEKIETSKPVSYAKNTKPGKEISKKVERVHQKSSYRRTNFRSKHKIIDKGLTGVEKVSSFFKNFKKEFLEFLNAFKELIFEIVKDIFIVLIIYIAIAFLVNQLMILLSAPSTLLEGDENPDSTGQKTITALMEHEDEFLEDIMDVTKYTYTEPSPYDTSQTIKVDKIELKEFVNENGELISDMGIYKEIFTLASRHFENDPDVDLATFENYCIELWDASHEIEVEYEEYEHAVKNDGVEACSNWQSYTHAELTGSEGDWYDSSTGEKCENYSEHCVEVSDTADSWWASCQGHERCFGHLKATVTVVVTTDLDNLMTIDPQKEPSGDWEGWTEENVELAKFMYEQDWTDFGITFPGSATGSLSASEVSDLVAQIAINSGNGSLSSTRLAVIQEALNRIGQYKYSYGANHSASAAGGSGSDCSGYVGQVLYQSGGYQGFGTSWGGATSFINIGTQVSPDQIQPGDIIVKNGAAGGATSSTNHVVIYVGLINGEPMVAECTTYHGISGSQLNPLSKVANYEYWIHMDY